jgi:mycothiol synthase
MAISSQPYDPARDNEPVLDLLRAARATAPSDRYPTTHRLTLLLASRLWDPTHDASLWHDSAGTLVGFALLWRRTQEHTHVGLECIAHPAARQQTIAGLVLSWAVVSTTERSQRLGQSTSVGLSIQADDQLWPALLDSFGFALQADYNVYMGRQLDASLPEPALPDGFTMRPLAGPDELPAYEALYSFAPIAADLRRTLLHDPDYLHLVAVSPDGKLVGFCECSVDRVEWALGGSRTAWIDYLGTRPDYRGRGLGRGLLLAAMRRMREVGAERIALITMGTNERAQRVYRQAGMGIAERDFVYTLDIAPPHANGE